MDEFDVILDAEQIACKEGVIAGEQRGYSEGIAEGFRSGYMKGVEVAIELGHYKGCASIWQHQAAPGSKLLSTIHGLIISINVLMGIDPSSDGFYEAYTKVQHTFKRVCVNIKASGVTMNYPPNAATSTSGSTDF